LPSGTETAAGATATTDFLPDLPIIAQLSSAENMGKLRIMHNSSATNEKTKN